MFFAKKRLTPLVETVMCHGIAANLEIWVSKYLQTQQNAYIQIRNRKHVGDSQVVRPWAKHMWQGRHGTHAHTSSFKQIPHGNDSCKVKEGAHLTLNISRKESPASKESGKVQHAPTTWAGGQKNWQLRSLRAHCMNSNPWFTS